MLRTYLSDDSFSAFSSAACFSLANSIILAICCSKDQKTVQSGSDFSALPIKYTIQLISLVLELPNTGYANLD